MKSYVKKRIVAIFMIGLFTLSCTLLNLGGSEVPIETSTQPENPNEEFPNIATATNTKEAVTSQAVYTQEASPQQIEPSLTSTDTQNIFGVYRGSAQWLCDNNPIWSTSLEFRSNGSVSATLSKTTDTASAAGSWDVSGNEISIRFERGVWVGIISENTISGTFAEENCSGVWSVTKD